VAAELPYLPSYKNVETLFSKIATARQPEAFTTRFLSETLGLTSSSDRALIALLKALGFLDNAGKPTPAYGALKNPKQARGAIGSAVRRAFEPLFAANENANTLQGQDLTGLVAQVAGTDSAQTSKIAGTFRSLVKLGDFVAPADVIEEEMQKDDELQPPGGNSGSARERPLGALRPEFHYNIQIHLPANGTEEVYLSIFNALRRAFRS
jgi:hypothetical protein